MISVLFHGVSFLDETELRSRSAESCLISSILISCSIQYRLHCFFLLRNDAPDTERLPVSSCFVFISDAVERSLKQ